VDIYVAQFDTPGTTGCQFRIVPLAGFTGVWLSDSSAWQTFGTSPAGIVVFYAECEVGSNVMLKVTYQLFGTSATCSALRITNHPDAIPDQIACDRCFQEYFLPASSMLVNCTVATEPTTWGKVKSLYRN
jgi:hypothetical protein